MKLRVTAATLLVFGLLVGFFVYSSEANSESRFPFRYGLDLSGGTLLTYEVEVGDTPGSEVDDAMAALRDVVERRVNLFGVSEPRVLVEKASVVSGENTQRLIVELPGITDIDEAVERLGETPLLEFKLRDREAAERFFAEFQAAEAVAAESASSTASTTPQAALETPSLDDIYIDTGLTGRSLKRSSVQLGGGHQGVGNFAASPSIVLEFNGEGKDLFAKITRENVGEALAIFLDGVPISEPVIQTEIPDGTALINGNFTPESARELSRDLNFGALPLPIELVSTQSIGAALGGEVLEAGVQAGVWGLLIVALFLILWYRLPGLLAVLALAIYIIMMLALFKIIPVTLTSAGIAGFILSIGMAVDANVLIFERMKEELGAGKKLEDAIREGFVRAWASIRDSNLSSLITAVILFWFGTSLVEGFALTFGVGILISMLTAVTVTRTFLLAVAPEEGGTLFGSGFGKKK